MSEWKQHQAIYVIDVYRDGWMGVWDALVAAITRKPRFSVAKPVTLSFWAKGSPNFDLAQVQMEKQS